MEPWKLAVIAALGVSIIGFGIISNKGGADTFNYPSPGPTTPAGVLPTPGPPKAFAKYVGTTLPAWPNVNQWANTPAPPNLASFKGKPVLLEVFRIECSHCQEAAPYMAALYARYAPRGVAFVGVESPGDLTDPNNPESNWTTVQQWIKSKGYTWPVGFDANSKWFQGKFGKDVFYPAMFLLDQNGKVVYVQSGHDENKALQLAVELERIAPGKGDLNAKANDIAKFLIPNLNVPHDAAYQKSLATAVATRLK